DDEFMARDIVSRYLEADGHQVTVAASAKEALDCFGKDQFDLVITDQAMPGMTGAQLTAALKEKSATQPVLVLTGFDDATEEAAGLPPGVAMVASKAISQLELRHAIARTMQRSRAVAQ
ncbi:MAG TPA: response regulator, partial [Chthoniobacteraceae bacterium]